MQLLLAKNEVNTFSLAAILGGQVQAEAIGLNVLLHQSKNARSSRYFEISAWSTEFSQFRQESRGEVPRIP